MGPRRCWLALAGGLWLLPFEGALQPGVPELTWCAETEDGIQCVTRPCDDRCRIWVVEWQERERLRAEPEPEDSWDGLWSA